MSAQVRVEGLARLRRGLRQLQGDADDLKAANSAAARLVAAAASRAAPRRTGKLAASVRGNKAVSRAQVRGGGARVPYAGPIHWGWPGRGITAQPFISEAAQRTEPVWLPMYQRDLQKAVDKVRGA